MAEFWWQRWRARWFPTRTVFGRWRAAHLRLGQRGERLAARLLREAGVRVLARNYTSPHGELDLVAREGDTLCFIEVKTRRHERQAGPAAAVNRAKRQKVRRAARRYLREIGWPALPFRFDIVEVLLDGRALHALRWHRHAFPAAEPRDDALWHAPAGSGAPDGSAAD